MTPLEFHKASEIFPLMSDAEFQELKVDIKAHGLREPIWIYESQILDGRNRYRACQELGIEPEYKEWSSDNGDDPVSFVVSMNLKRRHLKEGQRAMIAAKLADMKQGERTDLRKICQKLSQAEASEMLNVSDRSLRSAHKVQDQGIPELIHSVESGKVAVSDAARVVDLPHTEQADALEKLETGQAKTLKQAKQQLTFSKRKVEAQSLPCEVFNVILADPPWQYNNNIESWGAASLHYETLPLEKICLVPEEISLQIADDAVLFLWVTNPFLEDAFKVVKAWEFEYKTNLTWIKRSEARRGTGFYVRGHHELLFICTRGSFTPLDKNISPPISSVIETELQEHSKKPDITYEIIEALYPDCNYIELFACRERIGWSSWGLEIPYSENIEGQDS